ncbi:ATP-binding domain-containing protein [Cryobacterium tepidiphilum]|uniref:UvrD-like helicase C-terminal domain-containing protein n=1 Tax=Cryobacterium tepidiphilum TaxID=2486026 RepID=A0A3M8LMS7_9MICO|nr:ATP-binding domain-containing protein [Cryobacterium tepidiphilum]RNE66780.1 hypothetical protein EEJ31_03095 [Cryobacterium tepidiphilum]
MRFGLGHAQHAEESKGLEFDTVLLVEPGASTSAGRADLARLYVALTRATQRLVIVEHYRCAEDAFASSDCQGTTDDLTLERCTVNAWLRRGRPGA